MAIVFGGVSIQPKPKNGLEVVRLKLYKEKWRSFNPAEAREWFKNEAATWLTNFTQMFQSSRSQRMV